MTNILNTQKEPSLGNTRFITFEGPDGCGKSTQIQLTADYLRKKGYNVIVTREPGGTELAEKIREMVLSAKNDISLETEILLFLSARSIHVSKKIRPAIDNGTIVLCDRFADSTMVYQGICNGITLATIGALNAFATKGLSPDLTILLDADPNILAVRRKERDTTDRIEAKGNEFQHKVRNGFLELAMKYPHRIKTIDAAQTSEEVQAAIQKLLIEKNL